MILKTTFGLFMLLVLVCVTKLPAQQSRMQKIDSMQKEFQFAKNDSAKIRLLCKLAQVHVGTDSAKTFEIAERALDWATKNKDTFAIANAHFSLAYAFGEYSNHTKSKDNYALSKNLLNHVVKKHPTKDHYLLWAMSKYNLGVIYGREGFVNKEIQSMIEVLPIIERYNENKMAAVMNSNLGIRLSNIGKNEQAYPYFKKGLQLFEEDRLDHQFVYHNLAFALHLSKMDSLKAMKASLDQTKELLDKMPNESEWAKYYSYLGIYQTSIGEFEKALFSYNRAKDLMIKDKLTSSLPELYGYYIITYDSLKDYKNAKRYANKLLEFTANDALGEKQMASHYTIAQYEYKDKNYKAAYEHYLIYNQIKDSVKLDSVNQEMQKLEMLYNTEKKEKEILKLTNLNNETELSLQRRRLLSYVLGLIAILLVVALVSGYLFYKNKQLQAKNKEKEHHKALELLKHEQQAKIYNAMIESQEKERKRIAIELHDGLGGRLSAITLKLNNNMPKNMTKKAKETLVTFKSDIDDALIELRGIARNLMPETLARYGLHEALKDYCSGVQDENTKIVLQYFSDKRKLSNSMALTIFRVVQELINNALKHAKASTILVQYIQEDDKIDITIEDNGIGFDTESLDKKYSLGFTTLKTRVEYMNGTMDIQSLPNEGTTVNITINYPYD